jgi:hypothetical protein
LRQLLARTEIHETRAMVAASDALATFRVISVPASTPDTNVESVVSKEFPLDGDRMAVKWVDVHTNVRDRVVFAAALDRSLVKGVVDAVKAAGLEPVVVDLKSACIARAVTPQSCVVADLSSSPVELVLIDAHLPQLSQQLELPAAAVDEMLPGLLGPLRAMLRFAGRRADSGFGPQAPVVISSEQPPSPHAMAALSSSLNRPVEVHAAPARIPDVRFATYLTCLGLLMRRS